jgi:predicted P-loop ATPase
MADDLSNQERLLRQLIGTRRCQVCRREFDREHMRLAARHDQLWIVSVRCRLCRNQEVFWITPKDFDVETIVAEHAKHADDPVISGDDILDVHEFLKGFDGNFKDLFSS